MKGNFSSLDPKHPLFTYLFGTVQGFERIKPSWWNHIIEDHSLNICIRKDNYINIYYLDSCMVKIEMSGNGSIIITTHKEFLSGINGIPVSKYYSDISEPFTQDTEKTVKLLKDNIEMFYYPEGLPEQEKYSEKYIQWKWAINNPETVIDTEFAYNQDSDIPDLRMDIIRNDYGRLSFVELKRIGDNRMLRKDMSLQPEILVQMRKYAEFIRRHSNELLDYYQKIFDIKRTIGLKTSSFRPISIEQKPMLSIANLYEHIESRRRNRIMGITSWINSQDYFTWELFSPLHRIDAVISGKYKFHERYRNCNLSVHGTENNLMSSIQVESLNYFAENGIVWWNTGKDKPGPTTHSLSSQIHCLNHLFALRKDKDAILRMIRGSAPEANIVDILPSPIDKNSDGYITFEFVYRNKALLSERHESRGEKCTSIDALIYAKNDKGENWLFPIEWKYTEYYDGKEAFQSSITRYETRVGKNSNIKTWGVLYRSDPYYELARQTLLVENIISSENCEIKASHYKHIIVIPNENPLREMINKYYFPSLKEAGKVIVISPKVFVQPAFEDDRYNELVEYLHNRYEE